MISKEKLEERRLFRLKKRRLRWGDLITVCKYKQGFYEEVEKQLFSGSAATLITQQGRLDSKKTFPSQRVV